MDKREAKKVACAIIAAQVQNELDVGGYAQDESVTNSTDEQRLRVALEELLDELERRAGANASGWAA